MAIPTISVVIPNFNDAPYLKGVIEGYLLQSHSPLEIIVVDDGSTDNSIDIVKKIAHHNPRVKLFSQKTNLGVNKAIMLGLSKAKGSHIVFTAADDIVENDFLKKSVQILKKYPTSGFSFCDPCELIFTTQKKYCHPLYFSDIPAYLSPEKVLNHLKNYSFTFPSNTVVFNRKTLIKAGGFIPDLALGADWFACFVCAFRNGVCYIPEPLAYSTVRENSYSAIGKRDSSRQRETFFKIFELLYSKYPDILWYFKKGSIVYEYSWRAFFWLIFTPRYYNYISFPLIKRLIIRGFWNYLRNFFSPHTRKKFKKIITTLKIKI